jgi:peptide/nickel transport system permease protein
MSIVFFALKRLVSAVVVLFAVSVLTFLIFFSIPNGDPAQRIAGPTASLETIQRVRHSFGLDKPVWVQYGKMLGQIFNGRIVSYTHRVTVFSQIKRGLPATLSLAIGAAVVWIVVGVMLGVIGALRAGKVIDIAVSMLSFISISTPSFVVGSILLLVLTYKLDVFPPGSYIPFTQNPLDWFAHLVLPWITLAFLYIGVYAQVLRSSVLDVMTSDAVRTARAKGLSPTRVLTRHVLRMSLIPITSLWGLDFAGVLGGGTLVVEKVFNLNGVGQYAADSISSLDVPPVLVITLLGASCVVLMNAGVDVLHAILDPRIQAATS